MTCQDCGFELDEDYGSALLALEMKQMEATGRCIGCEFEHILKGESDGGTASTTSTTD